MWSSNIDDWQKTNLESEFFDLDGIINGTDNSKDTTITFVGGIQITGVNIYNTPMTLKEGKYKLNLTNSDFYPSYIYFNKGTTILLNIRIFQDTEFTLEDDCDNIHFYGGTPSNDTTIKFEFIDQKPQQGLVDDVSDLEELTEELSNDVSAVLRGSELLPASTNLFDKTNSELYPLDANGNLLTSSQSYAAYSHSDFISVNAGDIIRFYAPNAVDTYVSSTYIPRYITCYDANKEALPEEYVNPAQESYTVQDGVKFIRISYNHSYNLTDRLMVLVNNTVQPYWYIPYQQEYYKDKSNEYDNVRSYENTKIQGKLAQYSVGTDNDVISYTGYERMNLLFFTDAHIDKNKEYSRQNVNDIIDFALQSKVPISAIVFGGDAVTGLNEDKSIAKKIINRFFSDVKRNTSIPLIYTKGNHDLNDLTPSSVFTNVDFGDFYLDFAETNFGIVRQTIGTGKSTWHYYDINDFKVRVISLDIFDTDKSTTVSGTDDILYRNMSLWISQQQYNWLIETALNFDDKDEKDWGVIVTMHHYSSTNEYGTPYEPKYISPFPIIDNVMLAFAGHDEYSYNYSFENTFFNLNLSVDFTRYANLEKKPYFIAWLIGHRHYDMQSNEGGLVKIFTAQSSCTLDSSDHRVARVPGTITQNCFDIINIDLKAKKIRAIRYGAGENCYGLGGDRFLPEGLSF